MRKIVCVAVLAIAMCPFGGKLQAEGFFIPMPQILTKWKVGHQKAEEDGSLTTRYILEKETMENWSQLVNVQFKEP